MFFSWLVDCLQVELVSYFAHLDPKAKAPRHRSDRTQGGAAGGPIGKATDRERRSARGGNGRGANSWSQSAPELGGEFGSHGRALRPPAIATITGF